MKFSELMSKSSESFSEFTGRDFIVTGLAYDSRKIEPGNVFFAIKGLKDDGSKYIKDAISKGASAVIIESSADKLNDEREVTTARIRK